MNIPLTFRLSSAAVAAAASCSSAIILLPLVYFQGCFPLIDGRQLAGTTYALFIFSNELEQQTHKKSSVFPLNKYLALWSYNENLHTDRHEGILPLSLYLTVALPMHESIHRVHV